MLTVGDKFPYFNLPSVIGNTDDFQNITPEWYPGKWKVFFSWPKDFTFVCPTEISDFGKFNGEFEACNAQVLGFSTDSDYVHLAWKNEHPELKDLPFPMMSDIKRELSMELGILDHEAGVPLRATFIVDPEGLIQHVTVNGLNTGRNVEETVRTLKALQSGGLAPCGWNPGDDLL